MKCTFSQIPLSLSGLFGMNQICSEQLLCLAGSWADWGPGKFTKGKCKAQHLGCHKPCDRLMGRKWLCGKSLSRTWYTVVVCGKDRQKHMGLYKQKHSQQVENGDYSPSFSTCNATAEVLLPVLETPFFPIIHYTKMVRGL